PLTGQPLRLPELLRNRNALIFTAVWLVITLLSGTTDIAGNALVGTANIAWEAHIGGFIAGLAGFYLLQRGLDARLKPLC
ncbi:MAG: rhomboid family intramembrane serine protease, partial [Methylocella sp.]